MPRFGFKLRLGGYETTSDIIGQLARRVGSVSTLAEEAASLKPARRPRSNRVRRLALAQVLGETRPDLPESQAR